MAAKIIRENDVYLLSKPTKKRRKNSFYLYAKWTIIFVIPIDVYDERNTFYIFLEEIFFRQKN